MFYDRFYVTGYEGKRLSAMLFLPSTKPNFKLVVAHGFRGRKENSGRINVFAEKVVGLGGSLLCFDFGGSGDSEGHFSEMTLSSQVNDLLCVLDYAEQKLAGALLLLGRSFGGTTAIAAAARDAGVEGLILWSTPVLLHEVFSPVIEAAERQEGEIIKLEDETGIFSLGRDFIRDLSHHDFQEYLKSYGEKPLLIIQGEMDTTVNPRNADLIASYARGPVTRHLIEGADHRFTGCQDIREDITISWIRDNFMKGV